MAAPHPPRLWFWVFSSSDDTAHHTSCKADEDHVEALPGQPQAGKTPLYMDCKHECGQTPMEAQCVSIGMLSITNAQKLPGFVLLLPSGVCCPQHTPSSLVYAPDLE